jgi:hypothetical protein
MTRGIGILVFVVEVEEAECEDLVVVDPHLDEVLALEPVVDHLGIGSMICTIEIVVGMNHKMLNVLANKSKAKSKTRPSPLEIRCVM